VALGWRKKQAAFNLVTKINEQGSALSLPAEIANIN